MGSPGSGVGKIWDYFAPLILESRVNQSPLVVGVSKFDRDMQAQKLKVTETNFQGDKETLPISFLRFLYTAEHHPCLVDQVTLGAEGVLLRG